MRTDLDQNAINAVIEMAWCDKTSFAVIKQETGLSEQEVIAVMRHALKPGSFRCWRQRVTKGPSYQKKKRFAVSNHQVFEREPTDID